MPETNKNEAKQVVTFDAIRIGLASPEKILEWSPRRSKKAGDHQLQDPETGERRFVL